MNYIGEYKLIELPERRCTHCSCEDGCHVCGVRLNDLEE